ncbi:MAG: MFS transporter [Spirochaetaceae bacterium]
MAGRRNLIALFSAFLLMVFGSSLQSTLLAVRAGIEGFPSATTGLMMAGFFFGYAGGSVLTVEILQRVGYIRTFAALASVASTVALLHGIFVFPPAWALLRFAFGICYSGMVLIVESWLNAESGNSQRGQVLALYGVLFMLASGSAQFGLLLAESEGLLLFAAVSVLLSLSLLPTSLMAISEPETTAYRRLTFIRLYRISPFGTGGVVFAGLATGGFWTLAPRFVQDSGLGEGSVALFMSLAIAAGALAQWPFGLISDKVDRRLVILLAFIGTAIFSAFISLFGRAAGGINLYLGSAGFGVFALPLYSLCLAHINDHLRWEELVPATSAVVLLFGVASGAGSALAGLAMDILGPPGLYGLAALTSGIFLVYGNALLRRREPIVSPQKRLFQYVPRTTQGAARFLRTRAEEREQRPTGDFKPE